MLALWRAQWRGRLDCQRADPTSFELVNELADTSDTLLIGQIMAEKFIPHFEEMGPEHPYMLLHKKW
ncbi:MAG: hypothetical protein IPP61_15695 [Cytophagaceae bacterium]|nr:hypothetical protein [Cytophagaceae bacterium]